MILIQYRWKGTCELGNDYIYINTTAMRSGLPDGLVYWILPRCREVGFTRRFISCHGAVRSVLPDDLLVATVP